MRDLTASRRSRGALYLQPMHRKNNLSFEQTICYNTHPHFHQLGTLPCILD